MTNILTMLQALTVHEAVGNKNVFTSRYLNGNEVLIMIPGFKSFYDRGQEVLIYTDEETYSANKLELFDVVFITSVYSIEGCIYEINADFETLYEYAEKLHNSR